MAVVCLSVCLSVTSRCSVKTAINFASFKQCRRGLPIVFWGQRSWWNSDGVTPNGCGKYTWVRWINFKITVCICETVQDKHSFCERSLGRCMCSVDRWHWQWPWMTHALTLEWSSPPLYVFETFVTPIPREIYHFLTMIWTGKHMYVACNFMCHWRTCQGDRQWRTLWTW